MAAFKRTAKWQRRLTVRELRHISETSAPVSGVAVRPTLAALRNNLAHQRASGMTCPECEAIATKLEGVL